MATDLISEVDAAIRFRGMNAGDLFGYSLDGHGFVNRPLNLEDVIIGAPGFNNAQGRTYTFFVCSEISPGP